MIPRCGKDHVVSKNTRTMAAFGWQREKSVKEWLFSEAYRFDFFQAVRLLELIFSECTPVGEGPEPEKEPVHFSARVGFDFPAGEVHDLLSSSDDSTPLMVTNFLGLAGATGPLPPPLAELLLERVRQKDTGIRNFLDIFNHRLISLMYRTRKVHRVTLSSQAPERGPMANYLYAFLGLGISGLRNRMGEQVPDRVLLPYAGLLSQQPRSVIGMECMLSDHFRVPITVKQFSGVWRGIESDQWTSLGRWGKNRALGQTVVLGTRIWDQQGRFVIVVGPLSLRQFLDFLPNGTAYTPLCAMARFYAGQEFEFRIRLKLRAAEVPELRLGQAKLGWTTWLQMPREGKPGESKSVPAVWPATHKRDAQIELSAEYNN